MPPTLGSIVRGALAWATFGFFGVEMFVWAVFFSLLSKRVLVAAVLGVTAASLGVHIAAAIDHMKVTMDTICDALPWRTAIAAIVALADVWLAARWFREKRDRRAGSSRVAVASNAPARPAAFADCFCRPDRTAILLRLVWQHWRQSAWTIAAVLAVILVPLTLIAVRWLGSSDPWFFSRNGDPILYRLGVLPLLAMTPWLGLCVFLGDDRQGRVHFLSDRGVPPKYVWLSRQSVLLALVGVDASRVSGFGVLSRARDVFGSPARAYSGNPPSPACLCSVTSSLPSRRGNSARCSFAARFSPGFSACC